MEIPSYPGFRPLDITDKPRFDAAFAADPPEISEFTFTNIFAWRTTYDFRVSGLGGFIILSSRREGATVFFKPIGRGDLGEAVSRLAQERLPFVRVPEKDVPGIAGASGFTARPERDHADYLYSCRELIGLKGKKFDGKRNLIRKFKSHYAYEYLGLDESTSKECLDFEEFWCVTRDCGNRESLRAEREAVREMCRNFSFFGLFGGAIRVGGRICAAAIGQRLNADTMVMHMLKAVPDMPGLYQAMHNEFLSREGRGYEYVNMEQDLGIPGLRKAKLSYQPVRLIEKFRLCPA